MVQIVYSAHAKKRLFERSISKLEVEHAVYHADYVIKRADETEAYKSLGKKVLKVIYITKKLRMGLKPRTLVRNFLYQKLAIKRGA